MSKNCIACGSFDIEDSIVSKNDDYSVEGFKSKLCLRCGTNYIFPRPSKSEINEFYSVKDSNDHKHTDSSLNYYLNKKRASERRRDFLAPLLQVKPDGKLLDFGASTGWFVKMAQDVGYDAHGIDVMKRNVEVGRDRLGLTTLAVGDEDSIPTSATYDIITANNTIEHLIDPLEFLIRCKNALNENGYICLAYPDAGSFMYRYLKEYSYYYMPPYHLTHFTEDGIEYILKRAGFDSVLQYQHYEGYYFGHGLAHKIGLMNSYKKWRNDPDFVQFDIAIDEAIAALAREAGSSLNRTIIARKRSA